MDYIPLCSASNQAAVRGVLCYGGCPLVSHSRRVCRYLHLAPSAEKAPVPPVIAKLFPPVADNGDPGGAAPPANPVATRVPIGVPSLFKISKVNTATATRTVSAIVPPGAGAVLEKKFCAERMLVPVMGCPLTATMSATPKPLLKFVAPCPITVVALGSVANLETSEVSSRYRTLFATSICRIDAGVCARPGCGNDAAHSVAARAAFKNLGQGAPV